MRFAQLASLLAASVAFFSSDSDAATPAAWKTRTIYQIVTDRFGVASGVTPSSCAAGTNVYCGGTFQGIISKLDYIANMGFDAIWISPIVTNVDSPNAYHGYWAQDLYSINSHFGSASDLQALSNALHSRGMYLMIDVVANHMGPQVNGNSVNNNPSAYKPFNQPSQYHNFCTITNYNDQTNVEQCWLGSDQQSGLPDLNTENSVVYNGLYSWVKSLVGNYSVDGLRVDTVKHVRKDFWPGFNSNAGVYCTGEVLSGDPAYVSPYQQVMDGIINYPIFYPLTRAFQRPAQGFTEMKNMINTIRSQFKDPLLLTNFLENQDQPRFPSLTSDRALAKSAITYILTGDGIPIIYYGQEQSFNGGNDPYNREALWTSNYNTGSEMYVHISKVNKLRKFVKNLSTNNPITTPLTSVYDDSIAWVYRKAGMVVALSSGGSSAATQNLYINAASLPSGTLQDVISCKTISVPSSGTATIQLNGGQPAVYYPVSGLTGSGICGR
ncbi:related to alpha-amylase [Ustilago trichophora]|uniref:alpha-amylase n=1 Tax=Ustilago trichophora TaxID=86804 RepID=A0A5C3DNS3_9BASI|nr:related to alpha-amylase [Ustilago trichophora]